MSGTASCTVCLRVNALGKLKLLDCLEHRACGACYASCLAMAGGVQTFCPACEQDRLPAVRGAVRRKSTEIYEDVLLKLTHKNSDLQITDEKNKPQLENDKGESRSESSDEFAFNEVDRLLDPETYQDNRNTQKQFQNKNNWLQRLSHDDPSNSEVEGKKTDSVTNVMGEMDGQNEMDGDVMDGQRFVMEGNVIIKGQGEQVDAKGDVGSKLASKVGDLSIVQDSPVYGTGKDMDSQDEDDLTTEIRTNCWVQTEAFDHPDSLEGVQAQSLVPETSDSWSPEEEEERRASPCKTFRKPVGWTTVPRAGSLSSASSSSIHVEGPGLSSSSSIFSDVSVGVQTAVDDFWDK